MLYQINDGTVSLGGNVILDHIDFEIRGTEKIAVTGANGAGKTTLLQVLSGELELDGDDKRMGPGITMSRRLTVGMLKQGVFTGDDRTVDTHIKMLRNSLGEYRKFIATLRGMGYKFEVR